MPWFCLQCAIAICPVHTYLLFGNILWLTVKTGLVPVIRETPAQFENRIKPQVYVRRITKKAEKACGKCEFSPVKIHFSDNLKSFISRINEVYVFFNKISL